MLQNRRSFTGKDFDVNKSIFQVRLRYGKKPKSNLLTAAAAGIAVAAAVVAASIAKESLQRRDNQRVFTILAKCQQKEA